MRRRPVPMPGKRFGVGIVGVEPGRSWAARAHIPALRALSETFEIVGVANSSKASAEAAAVATGLPKAFTDVAELVAAPEVDIVTVAVKVPPHLEIVKAAIGAGKHVYCEWPLGNGLAEAEEMAALGGKRNPGRGRNPGACRPGDRVSETPDRGWFRWQCSIDHAGRARRCFARRWPHPQQENLGLFAGPFQRRHLVDDPGRPHAGGAHGRVWRSRGSLFRAGRPATDGARGRHR